MADTHRAIQNTGSELSYDHVNAIYDYLIRQLPQTDVLQIEILPKE